LARRSSNAAASRIAIFSASASVSHAFDAAITFQPPVGGVVTNVVAAVEGSEIQLIRKP
jgi:hypothetical protein